VNLKEKFGKDRVFNTPLSEQGTVKADPDLKDQQIFCKGRNDPKK